MRSLRWLVFCLIVASLGGGLGASQDEGSPENTTPHSIGKKRPRGNQNGDYALTVTGGYRGQGTATVGTTVSLQVKVTEKTGATGVLIANNLTISQGYFTGDGKVMGNDCTIQGRVDISSARDGEETDKQATTGRITGTFRTTDGKVGRLVAVQGSVGS